MALVMAEVLNAVAVGVLSAVFAVAVGEALRAGRRLREVAQMRARHVEARLRDAEVALAVYQWWTDGDVAVERRNAQLWVVELGDETRHARSVAEVRLLLAQHWGSR